MPVAERTAKVVWQGEMRTGSGRIEPSSGSFDLPVTFPSRLESDSDTTSPEELIAAAHASSYTMSLANTLRSNGEQPERLEVAAVCKLARTEDGLRIQEIELRANAWHQRLEQAAFEELAKKAEERCPVSNALRGSVTIVVNARANPDDA